MTTLKGLALYGTVPQTILTVPVSANHYAVLSTHKLQETLNVNCPSQSMHTTASRTTGNKTDDWLSITFARHGGENGHSPPMTRIN